VFRVDRFLSKMSLLHLIVGLVMIRFPARAGPLMTVVGHFHRRIGGCWPEKCSNLLIPALYIRTEDYIGLFGRHLILHQLADCQQDTTNKLPDWQINQWRMP
jgi:hypothetical protein